jgi:hypothetical protein
VGRFDWIPVRTEVGLRLGSWPLSRIPVYLPESRYQWPMHVLGQPGTGKSTLLANLALRLNALGEGVLVLDAFDGELSRNITVRADPKKFIYVSPGECYFEDGPYHWGINPLGVPFRRRDMFDKVYSNVLSMFERMDRAGYSVMTQVKSSLDLAIPLSLYLPEPTIRDVRRILTEPSFRNPIIDSLPESASELREAWERFNRMSERDQRQEVASTIRRLLDMLINAQRFYMLTQYHSTLRLGEWLDEGKLIVCNLADGQISEETSELLGNVILALFTNAVFARPVEPDRVWRLVADEFDKLAGNNFADIIDKARKRRVFPIMAHQHLKQLTEDRGKGKSLHNSVRNVPVRLNFRLSEEDIASMRWTRGVDFDEELRTLKDFTAKLTLIRGLSGLLDPGQPKMILLDPLEEVDKDTQEKRLQAAIDSQKAHTVSERLLRRGTREGDDDNQAASHHRTTRKSSLPQSREPIPAGDDSTGDGDTKLPVDLPGFDQLAGLQTAVPGPRPNRDGVVRSLEAAKRATNRECLRRLKDAGLVAVKPMARLDNPLTKWELNHLTPAGYRALVAHREAHGLDTLPYRPPANLTYQTMTPHTM